MSEYNNLVNEYKKYYFDEMERYIKTYEELEYDKMMHNTHMHFCVQIQMQKNLNEFLIRDILIKN